MPGKATELPGNLHSELGITLILLQNETLWASHFLSSLGQALHRGRDPSPKVSLTPKADPDVNNFLTVVNLRVCRYKAPGIIVVSSAQG